MPTSEATLTDFLRDPNAVVDRLQSTDVVLHRRNAEDLRLSLESRSEAIEASVELVSQLLLSVLADRVARERLRGSVNEIPWLRFLPPRERDDFFEDFFRTAQGAADLGVMAPLGRVLREWRATAAIHADPTLAQELRRPLPGDGGRVPQPNVKEAVGPTG
jgi:hypothetical protein